MKRLATLAVLLFVNVAYAQYDGFHEVNGLYQLDAEYRVGDAGKAIDDNFLELGSRVGPSFSVAGDPTVNDDSAGTAGNGEALAFSIWKNTSDDGVWMCLDATEGAAQWVELTENTEYAAGTGLTLSGTTFSTNDGEIDHNSLLNYDASEHIDWTDATEDLVTTGSGRLGNLAILEDATDSIALGVASDYTVGFGGVYGEHLASDGIIVARPGDDSDHYRLLLEADPGAAKVMSGDYHALALGQANTIHMTLASEQIKCWHPVGISGDAISGYPLTMYQIADSQGLRLCGYDDQSSVVVDVHIDSGGHTTVASNSGNLYLKAGSTSRIYLNSHSTGDVYVAPFTTGNPALRIYGYDSGSGTTKNGSLSVSSSGAFQIAAQPGEYILMQANGDPTYGVTLAVDGSLNLFHDNQKLTLGAAGSADSYLQYTGSALEIHAVGGIHTDRVLGSNTNTLLGVGAGENLVHTAGDEGWYNTGVGYQALYSNTTGSHNTANGYRALCLNTAGTHNTANGYRALYANTTGNYNTANGYRALYANTTGNYNTANGSAALYSNTTGSYNTALGYEAGRFIADGATANETSDYSTYLGYGTKASADNAQNETVIGYNAVGAGDNSVVLGNDSVAKTLLKGSVGIGTTNPTSKLEIGADNAKLAFGAAGADDSYLQYTGSQLEIWSVDRVDVQDGLLRVAETIGINTEPNAGYNLYSLSSDKGGVFGRSSSSDGVYGLSSTGNGVKGVCSDGTAVYALSTNGYALYARSSANRAGYFFRNSGEETTSQPVVYINQQSYVDDQPSLYVDQHGVGLIAKFATNSDVKLAIDSDGQVKIPNDNAKLAFGAAGADDSYLQYTGSALEVHAVGGIKLPTHSGNEIEATGADSFDIRSAGHMTLSAATGSGVYIGSNGLTDTISVSSGSPSNSIRTTSVGVGIGETSPDYKLDVNGSLGFTPGSSVTPVDNGDVVIEATANDTLTFKLKGSDGTVRSAALTLAP